MSVITKVVVIEINWTHDLIVSMNSFNVQWVTWKYWTSFKQTIIHLIYMKMNYIINVVWFFEETRPQSLNYNFPIW